MSIVEGMAGIRVTESGLEMNPIIPTQWKSYSFNIFYKNQPLTISIGNEITIENKGDKAISFKIYTKETNLAIGEKVIVAIA